jgi:YkoY family integral membrane protein
LTEAYLVHALTVVATLIVLEGLLSADNALVLAVLVRHLPKPQQKKALLYGIIGAFGFRFVMLLAASWIIRFWYLSAAGAAYLAYLSITHFITHSRGVDHEKPVKGRGFWSTVVVVELTDVAFAVDSVIAAVALSNELWLVYTGGMLGIIAMRFAAGGFLRVLEKWPGLEHMAYGLVGWIAVKLGFRSFEMATGHTDVELPSWIFWSGMGLIAIGGTLWAILRPNKEIARLQEPSDQERQEL